MPKKAPNKSFSMKDLDAYGFADPASSKVRVKRAKARQAIVIIGVDDLFRIFTLYTWAGRKGASEFRDKIIDVYEMFNPRILGVEANGLQVLFGNLVRDEAKKRLGKTRIVEVYQPTNVDKEFRIRQALEPVLAESRLFVQPKHVELMSEIRGFPTAATKDLIDCLATAITLVPRRAKKTQKAHEVLELARYLRNSGLRPALIEQRVKEYENSLAWDEERERERRVANGG